MKQIYFARHGLSEMNVLGLFSGAGSDTPLTDKGRDQAMQAGQKAKQEALRVDAIFASPMQRAHETAILIAKELGFPHERIVTNELLKERHFGDLEGEPYIPSHSQSPHLLDDITGIETIAELHERAKKVAEWLESLEQESVLIVSHGALGRALRRVIEGKNLNEHVPAFENATIEQIV